MTKSILAAMALTLLASSAALAEEKAFPARLEAHAILPANTIVAAPADAADYLKTSGKFSTADRKRAAELGSVAGKDGVRPTGLSLPFNGQPMQGFSGIKAMEDGTFWSLSDNGFGNKLNSTDAMLMLHHLKIDWDAGRVEALKTLFLSDPERKTPFPIVMEGSATRYLTGGDFDVESIQPVADGFWVGEEFGPYILKFDLDGKLTDVIATVVGGKPVLSPDNPALTLQADPSKKAPDFNLKRSGGYEGLALSKDARSSTDCSKGRSGQTASRWKRRRAGGRCGSSSSTPAARPGPGAAGCIRWPKAVKRSAISTCSTRRLRW